MDFFVAFFAHYVNPQLQFFHFVHHKFRSFNIDFFLQMKKLIDKLQFEGCTMMMCTLYTQFDDH